MTNKSVLLVLVALVSMPSLVDGLRVCATLDSGFDMLVDQTMDISAVTSESQLEGYHSDMREQILTLKLNLTYELAVLPSYGQVMVETRKGTCDVGWASFFYMGNRDRCFPDPNTCRDISLYTEAEKASPTCDSLASNASLCISKSSTTCSPTCTSCTSPIEPLVLRRPWRCCTDYSTPLLTYGIAFAYDARQVSFFEALIGCITNVFFINFISFIFILIVLVSHLIWFFERRSNADEFPTDYSDGIDDAVWWSLVTITTVGYGDKVPKSAGGKMVAVVWLFLGLFLYSILSGHMAATFADIRDKKIYFQTVDDLIASDLKICSYASQFAQAGRLAAIKTSNQVPRSGTVGCTDAMIAGEADVVAMDLFSLRYWLSTTPSAQKTYSIGRSINQYTVAVVYPEGTSAAGVAVRPFKDLIDPAIGEFVQLPLADTIRNKWAPEAAFASGEETEPFQWELVGTANALIIAYILLKIFVCVKPASTKEVMRRMSSTRVMGASGGSSGNIRPAAPVPETLQTVVVPLGKSDVDP